MEDKVVKRGRGRPKNIHTPIKHFSEKERVDAIRKSKTKYMLNKEWYCYVCDNDINYSLSGKHCHLKTIKHSKNVNAIIRKK